MKILWLNLRKRGRNTTVLRTVERLIERDGYDILMLQETFSAGDDCSKVLNLRGGNPVHLSADLSVLKLSSTFEVKLLVVSSNLVAITAESITAFNVHFSPYSSSERERDLENLRELLAGLNGKLVALGGDFNFAPRECDGLFGGMPSAWTSARERQLFNSLLQEFDLVDILALRGTMQEFSIIRKRNGSDIKFRCDFILCSKQLADGAISTYLHETREGTWAFSDHSGMSFEIGTADGA